MILVLSLCPYSVTMMAPSAWADSCADLESVLNSCNAKVSSQQTEIQSRSTDVQSLNTQVAQLIQERDQGIAACQQEGQALAQQIGQEQAHLGELVAERDQAARVNRDVDAKYQDLYHQKFIKWQCAVKDTKYANTGFGEGDTRDAARQNAITNGNIGKQVSEAGEYDFCFEVFRN